MPVCEQNKHSTYVVFEVGKRSKLRRRSKQSQGDQTKSRRSNRQGDQTKEIKGGTLPTWPVRLGGDPGPKLDQTFDQQHQHQQLHHQQELLTEHFPLRQTTLPAKTILVQAALDLFYPFSRAFCIRVSVRDLLFLIFLTGEKVCTTELDNNQPEMQEQMMIHWRLNGCQM